VALREKAHIRLGYFKVLTIAAGVVVAWESLSSHRFAAWWLLAPIVLYTALAIWHEQVLRARARADAAAGFYRRGILRIEDRWQGSGGETGERFRDAQHPYSEDLDIFGRGSLFELLSTARTPMGEQRLADWLRAPAAPKTIRERQQMQVELREKTDFRESAAVIGTELRPLLDAQALAAWSESSEHLPSPGAVRIVLLLLAACALTAGILYLTIWPLFPFLGVLVANLLMLFWLQKRASKVVEGVTSNEEALKILAEILERIESETFSTPRLQELAGRLSDAHAKSGQRGLASHAMRQLARINYWIDARDGYIVKLLEIPLLYTLQVAYAADAWRLRNGARVSAWLDCVGEIEALLSLAGYSHEHPSDPFPEIPEDAGGPPVIHAENLGHPLIAAAVCVRNPVRLDAETRVLLVSGSNMSGKSTFMRTVGVNAVLAMCGAPVRAESLALAPLNIGTRLRTADSLQEGRSGFYSEVLRLRLVFELLTRELPVLFLFDELLEGTNSHDRRIGAEGLLRALLAKRAIGIVTTHDLALTEVSAALGSTIRNVHFQDYVEEGKMRFDYKLQDGVVARSNAIELMRIVGLDV
jgi:hypothetical protein